MASAIAAIELVTGAVGDRLRAALDVRVRQFAAGLADLDLLEPGAGATPIFPVLVGDARKTMEASEALLAAGVFAQGIRPPTVPRGTARLRFSIMATHTEAQIGAALTALARLRDHGLLPHIRP
jgi:7-keto-8-aminopelargonate synthetase-like enzyme